MNFSQNGKGFLKRMEGFSPKPYHDANGFSIGYGCFLFKGTPDYFKYMNSTITEPEADELMMQRVGSIVPAINSKVKVVLTQNQFDALVSFCYNVGTGAEGFGGSTLLRLLNQGKYSEAAEQFKVWDKSVGKVLKVLDDRRVLEKALFLDGVYG